jgi:hypothetical protein
VKPSDVYVVIGALLVCGTALFNPGIIAIDDYNHGFAVMIPAQQPIAWGDLFSGIHPWLPKVVLRQLAQLPYRLGMLNPFGQLSVALLILGVLVYGMLVRSARRLFPTEGLEQRIALFLVAFYFALPLFSTRPMIETLCLPFLTLSGVLAAEYARHGRRAWMVASLVLLTVASLMRFQAGICGLGLLFIIFYRRDRGGLAVFAVAAAALFVLSGLPDLWMNGRLHSQLRSYVDFNLSFAGDHFGTMPFYVFFVLAFALTLPPAFLSRYRGFDWRRAYQPLTAPLLYVFLFLMAHSLSPHKEDRFFVPILPLFLFCLVPAAAHLWRHGAHWRKVYFLSMNAGLLLLACTNVPQKNLVDLARWLEAHPEINRVDSLDGSLVLFPQAFLARPIQWTNEGGWKAYSSNDCSRIAVIRSDIPVDDGWKKDRRLEATFEPAWLEQILVKTNPKNARRGPLLAYAPARCP